MVKKELPFQLPPIEIKPVILAALKLGDLEAAERLADKYLDDDPSSIDAQYLTGLVLLMKGDYEVAITWLDKARQASPKDPLILGNLGVACHKNKNYLEAEKSLKAALKLKNDYHEARYNLCCVYLDNDQAELAQKVANKLVTDMPDNSNYLCVKADVLRVLNKWPQAVRVYNQALSKDENSIRALINIAPIQQLMGNPEKAVENCRRAIALDPSQVSAYKHLGDALVAQEELDEAMNAYADAYERIPGSLSLCLAIAKIWMEVGNFGEAMFWYEKACEIDPDDASVINGFAMITKEQGDNLQVIDVLEPLLDEYPDNVDIRLTLSDALWDEGDAEGAIKHLRDVLEKQPQRVATHAKIGQLLSSSGDVDAALKEYEIALDQQKNCIPALNGLATTQRGKLSAEYVASMERLLKRENIKEGAKSSLHSGLAFYYDGVKGFEKSARHALDANNCQWEFKSKRGWEYEKTNQQKTIDKHIQVFNKAHFEKVKSWGVEDATPVFIVGMPRSGTTLTEQILARHEKVLGIGERNFASQSFMANVSGPLESEGASFGVVNQFNAEQIHKMGELYLAQLNIQKEKAGMPSAQRVVDKMPDNYSLVGWLATIFPKAKIIHCNRDPRDVALSCWMTQFGAIRWACQTDHLVDRIKQYRRIMDHWRTTIPDRFIELHYESLVENQEAESRRLIEWIGMDWDENCLKFYESDRLIRTASITQVRQPIYKRSVAKWKFYEDLIPELFDPLTELVNAQSV